MKRNIFKELKDGFHALAKQHEDKEFLRNLLLQGKQSTPADPADDEYFKKLRGQVKKK